jgi:hypothetical protein
MGTKRNAVLRLYCAVRSAGLLRPLRISLLAMASLANCGARSLGAACAANARCVKTEIRLNERDDR